MCNLPGSASERAVSYDEGGQIQNFSEQGTSPKSYVTLNVVKTNTEGNVFFGPVDLSG